MPCGTIHHAGAQVEVMEWSLATADADRFGTYSPKVRLLRP